MLTTVMHHLVLYTARANLTMLHAYGIVLCGKSSSQNDDAENITFIKQ